MPVTAEGPSAPRLWLLPLLRRYAHHGTIRHFVDVIVPLANATQVPAPAGRAKRGGEEGNRSRPSKGTRGGAGTRPRSK